MIVPFLALLMLVCVYLTDPKMLEAEHSRLLFIVPLGMLLLRFFVLPLLVSVPPRALRFVDRFILVLFWAAFLFLAWDADFPVRDAIPLLLFMAFWLVLALKRSWVRDFAFTLMASIPAIPVALSSKTLTTRWLVMFGAAVFLFLSALGAVEWARFRHSNAGTPRWRPRISQWAALALLVGTLVFLGSVMPSRLRTRGRGWFERDARTNMVTGFTNTVDISKMGELKNRDDIAMEVLISENGRPWTVADYDSSKAGQLLFKGNSLADYVNGTFVDHLVPVRERTLFRESTKTGHFMRLKQQVLMTPHGGLEVFHAGHPIEWDEGIVLRGDSLVATSRPRDLFDYTVVADVLTMKGRRSLRGRAIAGSPRPYWKKILFDPEFEKFALDLHKDFGSMRDIDRAIRLEAWFSRSGLFTYSRLNENDPSNPIGSFLLRTRRGYCSFFAGAMMAILREWRIPCRLVAGFRGGSYSGKKKVLRYLMSDAHAWVEVPVEGLGWVPFDPTPAESQLDVARIGERSFDPGDEARERSQTRPRIEQKEETIESFEDLLQHHGLKALVILGGGVLVVLLARKRSLSRAGPGYGGGDPKGSIKARLDRWLKDGGYRRASAETMAEAVASAPTLPKMVRGRARKAVGLLYRLQFSKDPMNPKDLASYDQSMTDLESSQ